MDEAKSMPLEKGRLFSYYENPWDTWKFSTTYTVWKMSKAAIFDDQSNIPPVKDLDKTLPIIQQKRDELEKEFNGPCDGIKFMWIGHASCLVKVDDVTILTDPVFSDRCSLFTSVGPKRYRNVPCSIEDLPKVDAVVISHNHYDHLDYHTVLQLNKQYADITWFVPKGMQSWMHKYGIRKVKEYMWWDESDPLNGVKFVFTPAQHWSGRFPPKDYNQVLWGSWTVIGRKHRFFFAGDTGYCEVFKEIGKIYGPFDLAAIPIGAYYPRKALSCQHVDPEEAVQIHKDIRSKESFGIHWGTFKLTYEHYLEPRKLIDQLTNEESNQNVNFYTVNHGEIKVSGKARASLEIEVANDALSSIEDTSKLSQEVNYKSSDEGMNTALVAEQETSTVSHEVNSESSNEVISTEQEAEQNISTVSHEVNSEISNEVKNTARIAEQVADQDTSAVSHEVNSESSNEVMNTGKIAEQVAEQEAPIKEQDTSTVSHEVNSESSDEVMNTARVAELEKPKL